MYGEENIGEEEADGRVEGKHGKGEKWRRKEGGREKKVNGRRWERRPLV